MTVSAKVYVFVVKRRARKRVGCVNTGCVKLVGRRVNCRMHVVVSVPETSCAVVSNAAEALSCLVNCSYGVNGCKVP